MTDPSLPIDVACGRALHAAVRDHIMTYGERGGPLGDGTGMTDAYNWCLCGWRSDDGPWKDGKHHVMNAGKVTATHLGNAMFASIRDIVRPPEDPDWLKKEKADLAALAEMHRDSIHDGKECDC